MIVHVAPRCIELISSIRGQRSVYAIDLSNVVGVTMLEDDPADVMAIGVDFACGEHVIAGRYDDWAEMGYDFGKLRVLCSLPAWPATWLSSWAGEHIN
jgi:hypothetical protein